MKNETVKANIAAAREANKNAAAVAAVAATTAKVSQAVNELTVPNQVQQNLDGGQQPATIPEEPLKLKSNSKKSMKSVQENNKENEEQIEIVPCN